MEFLADVTTNTAKSSKEIIYYFVPFKNCVMGLRL